MATRTAYDVQHEQMLDKILTKAQKGIDCTTEAGAAMRNWIWIACQFNEATPGEDPMNVRWDPTWEGWAVVDQGDRNGLVPSKSPGYSVNIREDGSCAIPATPNNIRRLDNMKETVREIKNSAGEVIDTVTRPPQYTRLLEAPVKAQSQKKSPDLVTA